MSLRVAHSLADWRGEFGAVATVVSIGNFDGIHLGHQKILQQVVARAAESGAVPAVLTFDPHPLKILRPEAAPPLISTLRQRITRMETIGIAAVLVVKFDFDFARLSPEGFVQQILADVLQARVVLVGANFRFGNRQSGDVELLAVLGKQKGFAVEIVPPVIAHGEVASSTAVRDAVRAGDVERATRLLGRPFALCGNIVRGTGTGSQLVVPTLNLAAEQELLPAPGVYATQTAINPDSTAAESFHSVTNVGTRPTFAGQTLSVESHLIDFAQHVSSGKLAVHFCKRLRDEKKFDGPEALRRQIQKDVEDARDYFRQLTREKTVP